jgi:hypothetical protein
MLHGFLLVRDRKKRPFYLNFLIFKFLEKSIENRGNNRTAFTCLSKIYEIFMSFTRRFTTLKNIGSLTTF